jgi:hypothetical protein
MMDAGSGELVGDIIAGNQLSTDIRPHLLAMRPGRTYVQAHAHPRSMPPSDQDIALFMHEIQLRAMVIAGIDGSWHLLSGGPRGVRADPEAVIRAFDQELRALGSAYAARVSAGEMTADEANRAGRIEAAERLTRRLGVRYTHL